MHDSAAQAEWVRRGLADESADEKTNEQLMVEYMTIALAVGLSWPDARRAAHEIVYRDL